MKQFQNSNATVLVLKRGEELIQTLTDYAREHGLTQAWLASGLGGASSVTIAWYELAKESYIDKTYDDAMEISSLSGNLSMVDGQPFWHIHGTFAGQDYAAVAGHVKSLTVGLTCELLITLLETPMTRALDEDTGLKLLVKE